MTVNLWLNIYVFSNANASTQNFFVLSIEQKVLCWEKINLELVLSSIPKAFSIMGVMRNVAVTSGGLAFILLAAALGTATFLMTPIIENAFGMEDRTNSKLIFSQQRTFCSMLSTKKFCVEAFALEKT
jgi:hypothetical protein